jgi:4-carboxymuconolactone decarboxylase
MKEKRRETSTLDAGMVALVRVATAIAKGDEALLRERMTVARAAQVPAEWVDELLLQSLLNVGYPLTLMAFGVWREVAGPVAKAGEDLTHDRWELWKERGAKLCAEVYGRTYHKLLLNLRSLHPALEALVVVDAYGKVLSRPGLDAQRRELCTLAAIAMLTTPRQLHAHLRGALFSGSTREEVDQVLALVEQDLDSARALKVWEIWADVRERKL